MNLGFYGHTRTLVFTYNIDGRYIDEASATGIRLIHSAARVATSADGSGSYSSKEDVNSDTYQRDYLELQRFEDGGNGYYAASRYLGYKEGKTPHNIFSDLPKDPDAIMDILFVFDDGFGGLEIPTNCKNVFWASSRCLPDRAQFEKIADRCFLMLDAGVLRRAGAMISRQISWERTATELVEQLQTNEALSYLLAAKNIFITFEVDGGALITKESGDFKAYLILTHGGAEGAAEEKMQGLNFGNFQIMVLMSLRGAPQLFFEGISDKAIKLRHILEIGEAAVRAGFSGDADSNLNITIEVTGKNWDAFEIPTVPRGDFLLVPDDWIITNSVENKQLFDIAFDYVKQGATVIDGLPQLSFGALTTIDRWEIESYQNIRNLILNYAAGDNVKPLSIAVFGSPGSGKSFGVTEIAKNILPGKVEKLEFNVSQFISPADLAAAFQKVRDVILEGRLPLVFFDEFDSDKDGAPLGWIKSFLMPMQDGRFRDGTGEHPLGKCILVFAGGTAATFEEFAAPLGTPEFKNVKGPDFLSRLKGTISILGPNPKSEHDKNFILRRALLLRSLLLRKLGENATIADGIIRAMLLVPRYSHGARSMEAIIDMSRIENNTLEPAALPFNTQLALHLNADAFIKLVSGGETIRQPLS
ncbi:MAG: AAA family ATPase [Clostridiales bacterium]|jgi:hypothetical protein|nr:AAA family ATPase [Clostridiales bacterium]